MLCLEGSGIEIEAYHSEAGTGQFELVLKYGPASQVPPT